VAGRSDYLGKIRSVVAKLGTQLLSDGNGRIDAPFVATIAEQVAQLRRDGVRVTIVSSGAIGCGLREMGLASRPTELAKLQAVAAVGQRRLMDIWAEAFEPHHLAVAQVLVTREDIDDRTRFLNLRDTISAVHEMNAVPIVNENDTVSTAELVKITFGDNDILAALLAHAMRADLLILLSVVDGLLGNDNKPVRLIKRAEEGRSLVRQEKSDSGKGGMDSKLQAAQMVNEAGDVMIVADGRMERILPRLLEGEELGTLFIPAAGKKRSSRSRWIGAARPLGKIVIDAGARRALVEQNKSLLPAGIVKVEGDFARGDVIAVEGPDGQLVGRGLSNYSSADVERVRGMKTQQVRELLAEGAYDEAVHRDNLVIERNT
jgi:glutamate 5-kinase